MGKEEQYRMSFTAGGLFLRESPRIAELFLGLRDWEKVREAILKDNVLRLRTKSSSLRVSRELCNRLGCLDEDQLRILVDGSIQESAALLWMAVCRQYQFVREFAVGVIREKYLTFQYQLEPMDFDAFFNSKAAWHKDLDAITVSTQAKLRQVLFRIMTEAGLISSQNEIQAMFLTKRVVQSIARQSRDDLLVFPATETELKGLGHE